MFPYQSPFGYAAFASPSASEDAVTGTRTRIFVPERSATVTSAAYSPPSASIFVRSMDIASWTDAPASSEKSCVVKSTHAEAFVAVAGMNSLSGGLRSDSSSLAP